MDRTPRYLYPPGVHPLEQRLYYLEAQVQELQHTVQRLSQQLVYEPYWAPPPADPTTLPQGCYKALASVPPLDSTNPTAALINFCRVYFRTQDIFECEHETITNGFVVRVLIDGQEVASAHRSKKINARTEAAKVAIAYLHDNPTFIVEHVRKHE
jgi:hypothetical protein